MHRICRGKQSRPKNVPKQISQSFILKPKVNLEWK